MRQTVEINGVPRTVIVDHSFHPVEQAPQTWQVFSALLDGFERQAGIIAFLLIMGGAFQIMNSSRPLMPEYSLFRIHERAREVSVY